MDEKTRNELVAIERRLLNVYEHIALLTLQRAQPSKSQLWAARNQMKEIEAFIEEIHFNAPAEVKP